MNNKKTFVGLLIAFAAILAAAGILYGIYGDTPVPGTLGEAANTPPAQNEYTEEGEVQQPAEALAPDFTVYDGDGNPVKLSDLRGKPVILNFWASWCGYCKLEMPDFQAVYEDLGDEIHFMMINSTDGNRETTEIAKAFIETEGYTFPVYFDTDYEANYAYYVRSLPTTILIDGEGHQVAYAYGALNEEALRSGIDSFFGVK